MKYFILVVIVLVSMLSRVAAQPVMTATDIPSIGGIYQYQFAKQNGVVVSSTGVNQIWDYSTLEDTNAVRVDSFLSVASGSDASVFPQSNLLARTIEVRNGVVTRNQYDYLRKDANSLKSIGYTQSGVIYFFRDPISPAMTYPFTYGNFYTDSSFLVIQSPNVVDSVKYIDSTYAVGYGTLKLPGNRTYTNVLQNRVEITIRTIIGPLKSVFFLYWTPGIANLLLTMDITTGTPTQIRYLTNYTSLPLKWIDFTGVVNNRDIQLSWKTGYERNTKYFVVERSHDGNNFKVVKQLPSVENSVTDTRYSCVDDNPEIGENYYRIKAVDKDGSFNYSKTILLNVKKQDVTVRTYPTIANKNVFLEFNSNTSQKVNLQILDESGRLIQRKLYQLHAGSSIVSLNTSLLSKGIYRIVFDNPNLSVSLFIKE